MQLNQIPKIAMIQTWSSLMMRKVVIRDVTMTTSPTAMKAWARLETDDKARRKIQSDPLCQSP